MKITTGFISNSSSSSFIIGLGIVPSATEIPEKCEGYYTYVILIKDILDEEKHVYNYRNGNYCIDSFDGSSLSFSKAELEAACAKTQKQSLLLLAHMATNLPMMKIHGNITMMKLILVGLVSKL